MPGFTRTGPLNRGRATGQGPAPCGHDGALPAQTEHQDGPVQGTGDRREPGA